MKTTFVATFVAIVSAAVTSSAVATDANKPARGAATIQELMALIVEPTSNGVFRAASEAPQSDAEWKTLQGQALTLLEIANTLTAPTRSKDRKQWLSDARAFQDESKKAFAAAMTRDAKAFETVSDSLYTTCANCHEHYMPK